MTTEIAGARPDGGDIDARRVVYGVLDEMQIAERAYHHQNFTAPLVADILARVARRMRAGDRVLLIGGSTLLVESLARLEIALDVWALPATYLNDEAKPYVRATVLPGNIAERCTAERQAYDVIVVPLLLEALDPDAAVGLMRALSAMLSRGGCLIFATANQSRLDRRLAALTGRAAVPAGNGGVSLGWPSSPEGRLYRRDELLEMARAAGLSVETCEYVRAEQIFMEMELLGVFAYSMRRLERGIRRVVPSTRDVVVLECGRRIGWEYPVKTRADIPSVSVLVERRCGGERLRTTLESLARQTYPADQYDIVVLDASGDRGTAQIVAAIAEDSACRIRVLRSEHGGPRLRNEAMAQIESDITAHTDDTCVLPDDWIESAIAWLGADTAAISGPVFASSGSAPRYLEVAGTRPDPDEKSPPSEVMFAASNVFYRTAVARAAGSFDETMTSGGSPAFGWDTELAWRLRRLGWQARYREEVYQFRYFPDDVSSAGWMRRQWRQAHDVPRLAARVPEYAQRSLLGGVFASRQTMYFDLAVAASVVAVRRRQARWLVLTVPWMSTISSRVDAWPPRNWPRSAKTVGSIALRQAIWLAGLIAGSIKARRVVL
ncbi:MAG TPA: glycosyltransferase [Dehalococcoidia bacterium]|nr:glycosyltransferase [Dehalococcoidia bacterium]